MGRILTMVCVFVLAISAMAVAQGTSLSIGTVSGQSGQSIKVPVNVASFSNVGAISLKMSYDPSVLTYTGVSNAANGISFTANGSAGVVALGWFDVTGSTPLTVTDGKLVDLSFTYAGGSCPVSFLTSQCEIANGQGSPITVSYSDGAVTVSGMKLMIGAVQAGVGQTVNVAIDAENFDNVGAISLRVQYDPAVLSFNSLANLAKTGFSYNATGGVVSMGWFDQTGNTPLHLGTSKLLDMNFTFHGGSSQLAFITAECEIADSLGNALTVTYVNGSVTITDVPGGKEGALPMKYDLLQNYPNPFNPTTNIQYELPKEARVTLKLYNLIGEEVATLVDAHQGAGRYDVSLNAQNLASGIYLYKITAGDFVATRKLVLAK